MVCFIIGLSALFIVIGKLITVDNAKYYLSGFNTMSKEEQSKIDLPIYITFFRKFHIFLGLTCLIIGLILLQFLNEKVSVLFVAIYPILAYIYFGWKSIKLTNGIQAKTAKISMIVLFVTACLVVLLMFVGTTESKLKYSENYFEIEGMYGDRYDYQDVTSISLLDSLPKIKRKTNGFAVKPVYKGYFKTDSSEKVKLMLNSDQRPLIYILLKDGRKIYYSAESDSNKVLFKNLENSLNLQHRKE